jgi:hypothetical protein
VTVKLIDASGEIMSNFASGHFHVYGRSDELAIVSSGSRGDMWHDDATILLKQFRLHYLNSYAALPSSTHIAESNVKDANFCQIKGRGEALASAFSTARSDLVEPINNLAWKEFEGQETYRGNGVVTSGTKEARTRKVDDTDFEESDSNRRVRGRIFSREAIKYIQERHRHVDSVLTKHPAKMEIWKAIHENIVEKGSQYAVKRVDAKVEVYAEHKGDNKPLNVLQRRRGIHQTSLTLGRVLYSKMKKDDYIDDVRKELAYRNLPITGGWRDHLLKRLKESEGDDKSFKPRCPDLADLFDRVVAADLRAAGGGEEE